MFTPRWKKTFIIIVGFLEMMIFPGISLGWATILTMFKSEGVYQHLCNNKHSEGCEAQDSILNLVFTLGNLIACLTGIIWGFLLEKWGLKIVRLLLNCFITSGALILCFINSERSFLVFPGYILLCFGCFPLRITSIQFAELYPSKRSTIISLYSGAFCASSVTYAILKFLYDSGLTFFYTMLIIFIISILLIPFTLFILPFDRIKQDDDDMFNDTAVIYDNRDTVVKLKKLARLQSNEPYKNNKNILTKVHSLYIIEEDKSPKNSEVPKISMPLKCSLWSWAFTLYQWWYCWILFYQFYYVGTLREYLEKVFSDDSKVENIIQIYDFAQIFSLILAPASGLFIDRALGMIESETDMFVKKLRRVKAMFWPLFITTASMFFCVICVFFNNEIALYFSIGFSIVFRVLRNSTGSVYIRVRFNSDHCNRLLGIVTSVSAIVTLVQFPLFIWYQKPTGDFGSNILILVLTITMFSTPLYLLITPIQTYLLRKEEREENEFQTK